MNLSTIEQGEELLKASTPGEWFDSDQHTDLVIKTWGEQTVSIPFCSAVSLACLGVEKNGKSNAELICWLQNHASELLAMAREVESAKTGVEFTREQYLAIRDLMIATTGSFPGSLDSFLQDKAKIT